MMHGQKNIKLLHRTYVTAEILTTVPLLKKLLNTA